MNKLHYIETEEGYFSGYERPETMEGPTFHKDIEMALKYDITYHKQEAIDDYAHLSLLGYDPSLETASYAPRHPVVHGADMGVL